MNIHTHTHAPCLTHAKRLILPAVGCLLILLPAFGCEEAEIESYQAPKSAPYTPPAPMGPVSSDTGPQAAPAQIQWGLPEEWQDAANGSSMALATFEVRPTEAQPDAADARITVTELTGQAGGILGNVNRWRGQVGLPPVEKIEQQPIDPVTIDGSPAGLIDLAAPPDTNVGIPRMLVVLLPRVETNSTWFFKMTGPDDVLSAQKPNFVVFVESVRFKVPADE